jgi:biopolymer transport protein ExbB
MLSWSEVLEPILQFMASGGYVLWGIAGVSLMLWSLIIERYIYMHLAYPRHLKQVLEGWRTRRDKSSWFAQKICQATVSEITLSLTRYLSIIKVLVGICPLLGLLGTVTGMIHVFDVLAIQGNGNVRAMAAGVSMATTPTMAGMVVALSGLFFGSRLQQRAGLERRKAANLLAGLED